MSEGEVTAGDVVGRGSENTYVIQLIGDYSGCGRVNLGTCVNCRNGGRMKMSVFYGGV